MNGSDILADLRAWRDDFARQHGYDLASMAAAIRELDAAAGERLVRGEPRRPADGAPGSGEPNGVPTAAERAG